MGIPLLHGHCARGYRRGALSRCVRIAVGCCSQKLPDRRRCYHSRIRFRFRQSARVRVGLPAHREPRLLTYYLRIAHCNGRKSRTALLSIRTSGTVRRSRDRTELESARSPAICVLQMIGNVVPPSPPPASGGLGSPSGDLRARRGLSRVRELGSRFRNARMSTLLMYVFMHSVYFILGRYRFAILQWNVNGRQQKRPC